jgi:outer membrane protein OmpA-like peptidoglycan-associated protein
MGEQFGSTFVSGQTEGAWSRGPFMTFRSLLLAGAVFPVALSAPAFALESAPTTETSIILAQAEPPCPEGFDCAPVGEAPAEAEQPAEELQPVPDEVPAEEPAVEAAPVEEPAVEEAPVAEEPPPVAEEPAAEVEQAPVEEPPAAVEEPPAEEPPVLEEAPAEETPPAEVQDAPAEAPAVDSPATLEAPADEPAADEPAATEEPAAEAPAADQPEAAQGNRRDRAVERARRRQQELEQGQGAPEGGAPAAEETVTDEQDQPAADGEPANAADDPAPAGTDVAEPDASGETDAGDESVVEQQLEAQGDDEEANQVRELRRKLRREQREAEAAQEGEVQPTDSVPVEIAPGEQADDDEVGPDGQPRDREARDRDRRDRDRADRRDRRDRRDRDGRDRGRVVEERGDRIIIDLGGGNIYVEQENESDRFLYNARDVEVQELPGGETRTIVYRENGSQIVTVRDPYGEIITRTRVTPNGREIVLIDNRIPVQVVGAPPPVIFEPSQLPPLVVEIPRERYIVDLGSASAEDIEGALLAPPVQQLERTYTLEQVTRNEELRAYVPRIDLDTITFEFGSATIANDQMRALESLGTAMEDVLAANPDEVYLIEGHTDAVGSDYDNLILSDQRAEAVAVALSQNFEIPPENLVTEGYGEQYLKVETEAAERQNRRVTVRRITPLLTSEARQ